MWTMERRNVEAICVRLGKPRRSNGWRLTALGFLFFWGGPGAADAGGGAAPQALHGAGVGAVVDRGVARAPAAARTRGPRTRARPPRQGAAARRPRARPRSRIGPCVPSIFSFSFASPTKSSSLDFLAFTDFTLIVLVLVLFLGFYLLYFDCTGSWVVSLVVSWVLLTLLWLYWFLCCFLSFSGVVSWVLLTLV